MLQLQNITKEYRTGELVQRALDGVTLNLRDNEFVSVLGPSGSGKTTLLNIIGGLDRYDTGDLIINGISTEHYKDRDWDTYRNHTIGFVFQSYNLIPHQTILSNVELALTIGGVSRKERRERAVQALQDVGLGDQLHKKPNQMSGGQMQRVAIARALVNDPDILLADEPTGALDSETGIQVMELLKKVAEDRLVVMVTHNPELAERYSTRIVRLKDGRIIDDTNPLTEVHPGPVNPESEKRRRAKMSFRTALSLSFNNLKTKKGRTILTAFAGSIGIIGIALILSLSSGVNDYIQTVQKNTMASYPLVIRSEDIDLEGIIEASRRQDDMADDKVYEPKNDGVHTDLRRLESEQIVASKIKENNLTEFKHYLDNPDSEIHQYLGKHGVVYSYDIGFTAWSYASDGTLTGTDADPLKVSGEDLPEDMKGAEAEGSGPFSLRINLGKKPRVANGFSEMMPGQGDEAVSSILKEAYDVVYGEWPKKYDEVVLVLNRDSAVQAGELYQLGLMSAEDYAKLSKEVRDGKKPEVKPLDYKTVCEHEFYLLPSCDLYEKGPNGTFTNTALNATNVEPMLKEAIPVKITAVIRPKKDTDNATLNTPIAYTAKLTDHIIRETDESPVVKAQEKTPEINILTGMPFQADNDDNKAKDVAEYLKKRSLPEKAAAYLLIRERESRRDAAKKKEEPAKQAPAGMPEGMMSGMGENLPGLDEKSLAAALDRWLEKPDRDILVSLYTTYIGKASYEGNLEAFGKVSYDAPSTISIYTDSFEAKDGVSTAIEHYNASHDEKDRITYTDYVKLLTGSVTSIINVISYVLIAFVAVSLIVSSIMIGIITHISVMERTKEIGILRAMGASKRNISQVFNAETVIVGVMAGVLGVVVSALLTILINSVVRSLMKADDLTVVLPIPAAVGLVILSTVITVLAGLLPARSAAKKDPVLALRTE